MSDNETKFHYVHYGMYGMRIHGCEICADEVPLEIRDLSEEMHMLELRIKDREDWLAAES